MIRKRILINERFIPSSLLVLVIYLKMEVIKPQEQEIGK